MNEQLSYGPRHVAKMLGVSPGTVYRMIQNGTLSAVRFGPKRLLVPRHEIDAIFTSRKREENNE